MVQKSFLVDVMLIKLGRWLRILGYDCNIPNPDNREEIQDAFLASTAKKEGRVLLTMDRELSKEAEKHGTEVILIPSNLCHIRDQLRFLFKKSILDPAILNEIENLDLKTKCARCGGELELISKENFNQVQNLNDWIRERHSQVWVCKSCKQVYWKGSHWKKMIVTLEEIKSKM